MTALQTREGLLTGGLLLATVYAALYVVAVAGWGEDVAAAPLCGIVGALLGFVAAKSPLRGLWALLVASTIGVEIVLLIQAAITAGPTWAEKLGLMSASIWSWYFATLGSGPSYVPQVFAFLVNGVGLLLGLSSAWLVFRLHRGWAALVLIGAAGVVHLSYVSVDSVPRFLISLFLGVVMVASLELHLRQGLWREIGAPVQPASTAWTLVAAGGVASISLTAGFHLPSGELSGELAAGFQALTEPWTGTQNQIDKITGGGRAPHRPGGGLAFGQGLVPRKLYSVGSQPVLSVASPRPFYWRGETYDRYTGHSIERGESTERHYGGGQELPADPDGGQLRLGVEQRFTILAPSVAVLFAADAPSSYSISVTVDEGPAPWDLASSRVSSPVQRKQSYSAMSSVTLAGRRELAEAPAVYPEWTSRYLELPNTLPTRVRELSSGIAANGRNPLERALALESYLRGFTYSTHAEVPSDGRDWVDYLLFDSKSGYCDYFATALVVMLRTQGVPARVASGFAPGTFDGQENVWVVRESDAHSWTEAYFPGYGWSTFEPSALRPLPERPESGSTDGGQGSGAEQAHQPRGPGDEMGDNDGSGEGPPSSVGIERTPLSVGLAVAALLLILPGISLMLLGFAWNRGLSTEPSARRRYGHLRRSLRLGRADVPESATPFERANWVGAHLPDVAAPVELLVRRHVEATYGGFSSPDSAADSEAAWRLISRPLLLAMVRRRLGRVDPDAAWQATRRPRWAELLRRRGSRRGPKVPGSTS